MKNVIAIRKETKDKTQRRVPLVPEHVRNLVKKHGVRVLVEPWEQRIFSDAEYKKAGAILTRDLSQANIVFGVKEVAPQYLLPDMAYCFFSHVIKGQTYNMGMLKDMLNKKTSLLDYELVKDHQGKRLIFFGEYAGLAGTIDTMWALGKRLLHEGIKNPFSHIKYATNYLRLYEARDAFLEASYQIAEKGLPRQLTPLVVGITGTGHVTKGAISLFDMLPTVTLNPEELESFFKKGKFSNKVVYEVLFQKQHLYKRKKGSEPFNLKHFNANPSEYTSGLERYLPYLTVLINGIYWDSRFPKLVTKKFTRDLFAGRKKPRLRVIGDITCDIEGSIEINLEETNMNNPVYVYDVRDGKIHYGVDGKGPVVLAVDKLPNELAYEASTSFGTALLPFVPMLARADFKTKSGLPALPPEFIDALIVQNGKLSKNFSYLNQHIKHALKK
ncbi:MAG: hypothetical protein AMXMBFR48_26660 [Ignavibacteriales bacterium]